MIAAPRGLAAAERALEHLARAVEVALDAAEEAEIVEPRDELGIVRPVEALVDGEARSTLRIAPARSRRLRSTLAMLL